MIHGNRAFGLALLFGAVLVSPAMAINLAPPDLANPTTADSTGYGPGIATWGSSTTLTTSSSYAPATYQAPAQSPVADGFVNFGPGPYPDAASLASGSPQPWFNSQAVANVFGGTPTAQQQASFEADVLRITRQAFAMSGIGVNLTDDPTVAAAHTLSLVSNASSIPYPGSIGTTNIGGSGFSFVDQEAEASPGVAQLELIVAHNLAHELMLSFGVPEAYDQSGKYIDSTTLPWSTITSPTATFSPAAAAAINQALQSSDGGGLGLASPLAQFIGAEPVPEPTTVLAWGAGLLAVAAASKRRARRASAARA